jgi:hypothetical protein
MTKLNLTKKVSLINWLKNNWEHYEEDRIHIEKMYKKCLLIFAVKDRLVKVEIKASTTEEELRSQLSVIENDRVFKLQRVVETLD